mmetsp:Transcript_3278/g.8781  ORF Transcript_3278/g.8781 Transcript_3278/m.8781 type:complete len:237 (-) Transcript_3278:58-768(-)
MAQHQDCSRESHSHPAWWTWGAGEEARLAVGPFLSLSQAWGWNAWRHCHPAAHSCRLKPPWKPRPCRGLAGPQCPGSALAAAASEPAHWAASPPLLHPRCPQHCCCCRCCCCYWPSLGRCGVAAGAAGLLDCYCLVAVGGGAAVHFPTGHRLAGSGRGLPSACLGCPPEGMCTAPGPSSTAPIVVACASTSLADAHFYWERLLLWQQRMPSRWCLPLGGPVALAFVKMGTLTSAGQ